MDEKEAALDRATCGDPSCQLRSVGMTGIVVDVADRRRDLDFVALNPYRPGAVNEFAGLRQVGAEGADLRGAIESG